MQLNLGKEKLMNKSILNAFWNEEAGQDMVEYALLLAFVALAAVAVLGSVRSSISSIWGQINTTLSTASTGS
jgi:Flp pilus assembly pilin Flp